MSRAPIIAFEATVVAVEDLSPAFRRITLGGPGLADFGVPGHPRDLRFKLVIPPAGAPEPAFDLLEFLSSQDGSGLSWYQSWLQLDPQVRGSMRTYTVREWRDEDRELVVDMVLHTDAEGHSGPAASWAQSAEVGHRLHLIGPTRYAETYSGLEFEPGGARQILLAGDETAVPAIASILDFLRGSGVAGRAILEVPTTADFLEIEAPDGFEVQWLARGSAVHGELLEPAVREAVRAESPALAEVGATASGGGALVELEDVDIDSEILWDVPAALTTAAQGSSSDSAEGARPFYAWIAGEAGPVKRLRRYLVQEVGVDRKQIAFMGYWRAGRAES
ncbi:NADPH-dependent ferric siderophore reductase [Brevibacterium sanguinis]|uniref:NADPH-dependent ferric siderophore reductase n=2 Tax=Brevibacterium TaxID=1696 RepID=A0A366IP84_9MICO|nr:MULTISPECIES: siderophore-interacting protein [Brevibacterium]RBP67194.1 NADPH-dependent ferric siderophore reductase [Brevibacterium sanguinis]RBP73719.1 NADPH-dependent ferric siderophore reductase [Brevibacterium celere]